VRFRPFTGRFDPVFVSSAATHGDSPVEFLWLGQLSTMDETLAGDTASGERSTPALRPEPGTVIGRYVLGRRLGSGGMGVVFAARDTVLDTDVALKLVPSAERPRNRVRLLREARAMARLQHPNVVRVLGAGQCGSLVYVAMDLIHGTTLSQWLRAQRRSWREILTVLIDAGRGLAAAHAAGLVHRDFKPDNVMIGTDGRVFVLDFGLAQAVRSDSSEDPPPVDPTDSLALENPVTRAGALAGTPRYMAPEQIARRACEPRTDQFAFCVTALEALDRRHPFAADTLPELALAITQGQVRRPRCGACIPRRVRKPLLRGLHVDPQQRHRTMQELLATLETALAPRRHRVLAWIALAAVTAATCDGPRFGHDEAQVLLRHTATPTPGAGSESGSESGFPGL
jgi:eukaryotic-like serine/threonine-protein kinase